MSRRILHLNHVEEATLNRIAAEQERTRSPKPCKPRRERPPEYVRLNGRLYIPANDERERAERELERIRGSNVKCSVGLRAEARSPSPTDGPVLRAGGRGR